MPRAAAAAVLAGLAACSGAAPAGSTARADRDAAPRLVVLVVIDQWPEWAFEKKRPAFHEGFDRLLSEGEWRVGVYPSAATLTGPDHALLGTGEPPYRSGIVSDEWWHRDLAATLEACHDLDGSITAKWLRVPGLGDAIARAHTGAKAVDVALKPRAAILPLGHAGLSIWYDGPSAKWTSFAPPQWLGDWNRTHAIEAHLHDVWTPSDPARLAELSGRRDDEPGEVGMEGFGPTFPHDPQTTKSPGKAVLAMPLGNEIVLELAAHAIEAEQLGNHGHASDLLVVGLSAHDYVGHGWGQESWEMWDMELRLDAQLGKFLDALDREVGVGKWAMVVTADHGASPLPETIGGGRLSHAQLKDAANHAAAAVLGEGAWVDSADYPTITFSKAFFAQPAGERLSAEKRVMNALRSFPGIERVGRVADVAGHCEARTGDELALCLTFDPERSGELFYLPARGWILEDPDEPTATAHGSLHDYDRQVPVILLAPRRTAHDPVAAPAPGEFAMTHVAPLLAKWLGVPPPASAPAK